MTHDEVLEAISSQKVPQCAVVIVGDSVEDLDGLRAKVIKIKNIIGVARKNGY